MLRLFRSISSFLSVCTLTVGVGHAQTLGAYGTPSLIDMPTAEILGDGQLSFTSSHFGHTTRNTLGFQLFPRVYGTFRYAIIRDFDTVTGDRYDRSFDLHFLLAEERENRPAIAFGLRDFGGTGLYSSEYLVATKHVRSGFAVTGGLGWGRLGERNGFSNPLGLISDRFKTRPNAGAGGLNQTGRLDTGSWFRGDVALFGGIDWKVSERISLQAEYSSDLYSREKAQGVIAPNSPFSLGLSYRFDNGVRLHTFALGGDEIGFQLSYVVDPAQRPVPGGTEPAAPPLVRRATLAAASWNQLGPNSRTTDVVSVLKHRFNREGMTLQGAEIRNRAALIRVQNNRWDAEAQAAGRAARILANTLAPDIERFTIVFQQNGLPISKVTTQRSDLQELEHDFDGSWRSLARASIEDAAGLRRHAELSDAFPRFDVEIRPYTVFSLFDPDNPLRGEIGGELFMALQPAPGLSFAGTLRYPFTGNISTAKRRSNSELPHVRSDGVLYAEASDLELNQLTTEYLFRPGENFFSRVTAGYLEPMFAGVSIELLWFPLNARWALGGEVNHVWQRDFDMLFGLQDYDVLTGHASGYYDFGNGYHGQMDVGRYLAGDWGATLSLTREFNNGFKVGAYVTLTDVPFSTFGEGSFDKGIRFELPVSWLTGKPTRERITQVIQPVVRDGGARLNVRNRLYAFTRDYRARELQDSWGRYFR